MEQPSGFDPLPPLPDLGTERRQGVRCYGGPYEGFTVPHHEGDDQHDEMVACLWFTGSVGYVCVGRYVRTSKGWEYSPETQHQAQG